MKLRKIFLLLMLTLLFLGLSYATEVSNDTTNTVDTSIADTNDEVVTSSNTPIKEIENNIDEKNNKEISKQYNDTVKTESSKTYTVNDFNTLHNALTSDTYSTVTLNIKSDIILASNTHLNYAINKLTINGNGKTIDGDNQYQFLEIFDDFAEVNIKNIKINKCYAEYGGAIRNFGKLTITNSVFEENSASRDGGAIFSYRTLIIRNSTLNNNKADGEYAYGGAINNKNGTLTVTNTILNNNDATDGGGAIYNNYGTLTVNNSTFNNNTSSYGGGAIYNNVGNSTVTNTILNNNKADGEYAFGGAIYNEGTLTVTNAILNNNKADGEYAYGGAICNFDTLILINSTLNNNKADGEYAFGGAIYNNYATLTVTDTLLNNNTAGFGGAIYSEYCTVTVTNNTLYNNTAGFGGAIHNKYSNLTVTNSTLNNNNAKSDGGAIYNSGTLTVTDTLLNNNSAKSSGGAICNDEGTLTVTNSTLNNNTANLGGAICNEYCTVTLTNSTLYNNTAKWGGAIRNFGNLTLINSTLIRNAADLGGDAIMDDGNLTIINSIIDDGSTLFKHNYMSNVELGTTVSVVGRLISNIRGIAIKYAPVTIKINDNTYNLKTDGAGYVRMNYTVNNYDEQKITFTYDGNDLYLPCTNSTTFKVKQPTWIKMASMNNVNYGSTVKVVARLLYNGTTALKYTQVNVKVNNKVYQIKSDKSGYIRLNYTVDNYDTQKISIKYAGSTLYLASTNSTTFKVKQPTGIKIASMTNVKYGSAVKIVARLLYNGTNALKYKWVNVTVNGKISQVKTDGAGYIRLNYTVDNYDTQKISIKYLGDNIYQGCANSTTFKVKQPTWIKHAYVGKVKQGSTVKIVGRLLYNGTTSVKYVKVNLTVNGKVYSLKTDGAGYYRLNYTATNTGKITFTSSFAGNDLYLASTNSTTFTVVKS